MASITGVALALIVGVVTVGALASAEGDGKVTGLVILFVFAVTPALVRAFLAGREGWNRPLTTLELVGAFFGSVGVVLLIGIAAVAAFLVVCFPVGLASLGPHEESGRGIILAFILGIIAAGLAAYTVVRWFWWRD
jgi:hypothetical protein